ncbi:hypothetical protein [Mariniluteicoccus endophyticus]
MTNPGNPWDQNQGQYGQQPGRGYGQQQPPYAQGGYGQPDPYGQQAGPGQAGQGGYQQGPYGAVGQPDLFGGQRPLGAQDQQQNPWGHADMGHKGMGPQGMSQAPMGGQFQAYDRLAIRQKLALTVNRYEVSGLDPQGNAGPVLAFAEQKRLAFKELVTFFTDESRTVPVFSFKARQMFDLGATYDVFDANMQPIGWFRKDFGKSLMRSTWYLGDMMGNEFRGTERSAFIAILRRLGDSAIFDTWYHFDFSTQDGQNVMHHSRAATFRDMYAVDLPMFNGGQRLDWRLAAAMGVALDALQAR